MKYSVGQKVGTDVRGMGIPGEILEVHTRDEYFIQLDPEKVAEHNLPANVYRTGPEIYVPFKIKPRPKKKYRRGDGWGPNIFPVEDIIL
jgi:hypothetical protein